MIGFPLLFRFMGLCLGTVLGFLTYLFASLPTKQELSQITMEQPLQIFSQDGYLLGEIGHIRRYPVSVEEIPDELVQAFLSIEDNRFFQHPGVDLKALIRACFAVFKAQKKVQGGSTITMQVARNFYLTRDKTYFRKLQEILLALKLEQCFPKQKILELYLNKIFLGHNSYGVVAAAHLYFGKNLSDLSLAECATLAGLPKAPSLLNPLSSLEKSIKRRNDVLKKMHALDVISNEEYEIAQRESMNASYHQRKVELFCPTVIEFVKNELKEKYGDRPFQEGWQIYTTIIATHQEAAQQALDQGLKKFDQRHAYRGTIGHESDDKKYFSRLSATPAFDFMEPAILLICNENDSQVLLSDGSILNITSEALMHIRVDIPHYLGLKRIKKFSDYFKVGDIVYLEKNKHIISQIPLVRGACITLDNKGQIIALVGGLSFLSEELNRAIQAQRQIGSTFKSLVFAQAFEEGFQVNSLIQDTPLNYKDKDGFSWKPQNDQGNYLGTISIEEAFIKSRNLGTLSIVGSINLPSLYHKIELITKTRPANNLTSVLGSFELSPMKLAQLYVAFNNAGIAPTETTILPIAKGASAPSHKLFSPQAAYLLHYLLEKNICTTTKDKFFSKLHAGGKTGTTSKQMDGWYAGCHGELTTVVWVGFDQPAPLYEYAANSALPIWIDYVKKIPPSNAHTVKIPYGIIYQRQQENETLTPLWISSDRT